MTLQNPNRLFPLFITDKLESTKRYYVDKLGFEVRAIAPNHE